MSKLPRRLSSFAVTTVLLAAPLLGWTQRWQLFDWYRLQSYTAPAEIAALADRTTMTDYARRLFYVYRAALKDRQGFNEHCHMSEQTIVLGCYVEHDGIYIYKVEDHRLAGIVEVTAAHEMLHAAYGRLSRTERQHIDGLTQAAFARVRDQRIIDTVESYRSRDEAVVPNELHSIIATEVRDIGPELEAYYQRYFNDRLRVVGYAEQYERAFSERKEQVKALDAQLQTLKAEITHEQAALDVQREDLNRQKQHLDQLLAAKRYEEYNAGVAPYNQNVRAFNDRARSIQELINRYNNIVAERNAIAHEENELLKAIDSRPQTIETE